VPRPRIGLLGGSFNPAHRGHRRLSLDALARLGLDRVWWLVSPQNVLKPEAGMAPFAHRLQGARALAAHRRIRVSDFETRAGTRYTVDTLAALARACPGRDFVFLAGADILAQLPRWRRWRELARNARLVFWNRPGHSHRALRGQAATALRRKRRRDRLARRLKPGEWCLMWSLAMPVSGTAIRQGL